MEPCKECGAYKGHSPLCSLNTPEEIKIHLETYFKCYQEHWKRDADTRSSAQVRINRANKEREFWKGKFFIVKEENNKLRKKLK